MDWKRAGNTLLLLVLLTVLHSPLMAQQEEPPSSRPRLEKDLTSAAYRVPVKIAILNNFPPFSFRIKGKLMGFTVDYIHLLEEKTGLAFEIIDGSWENNFHLFKTGEVDLITAISYTEERTGFTRYTDPYYIIPTVVYLREDTFSYRGVQDLEGKTVGIESDIYYKSYLEDHSVRIKEVEDTNDLMKQLSFGEVDAVVTNINIGNYMKKKHVLDNVKMAGRIDIPEIKDEDLRIGVRREHEDLHALVQNGINQISPREYKALQDRWVGFTPDQMLEGSLLPEERALIQRMQRQHGGIRLSCRSAWYPFDFFTDGHTHQGIAADLFSRMGRELQMAFVARPADSFQDAVAALVRGDAEILPAVVPSTELRDVLAFTKPYATLPLVVATGSDEIFIKDLASLEGRRIGYVPRGMLETTLMQGYPRLRFVAVESVREGLERVRKGRDFAFVGTIPAITYAIQKHDFYNIKISGTLKEQLPFAAAVKQGEDALLHIVQKGLNAIPLDQRRKAVNNWISIRFDEEVDARVIWGVVSVAALAVLLIALWNRKIKSFNHRISEANQLLAEKNSELEHLSITDKLTGLYNRSKLEIALEEEQKRFDRMNTPFSIIIFDVDRFKSINDTYGHTTGDRVLREIAGRIRQRTREVDVAGRWGGEEFLVICPGTDAHGAGRLAEDVRRDVEAYDFGLERGITISAGFAGYRPADQGIEGLVNRADQGLYQAKKQRNGVSHGGNRKGL